MKSDFTVVQACQNKSEQKSFFSLRTRLSDEKGSISPLVIVYFLITLIVIFIGINVSHTYLERRHLIFALESSLQRAAQEIDDLRYYTGYVDQNTRNFGSRGETTFLPINCEAAKVVFAKEFQLQWTLTQRNNRPEVRLKGAKEIGERFFSSKSRSIDEASSDLRQVPADHSGEAPMVTSFHCDGRTIRASAEVVVNLPFVISFAGINFISESKQKESVEVGLIFGG